MLPMPPISFVHVRRQYHFRSIEMGRWVSDAERDKAAAQFHGALQDLMMALAVPEEVISLRGQLGLQFGKGGRLGVSAHYSPLERKLALAKNAGAGSLAHEWFHAFDHYMGSKMFQEAGDHSFASKLWLHDKPIIEHALNQRLAQCFAAIILDEDGSSPSTLFSHSKLTDRRLGVLYYAKPEELCARAFEAFIEDACPHSRFLVKGTLYSDEAKAGLYPSGSQRQKINEAFHLYFAALGQAVMRQSAQQQQ
ncbi:hypothetical protein FJM67_16820 [Maribrevibacterium harenarium]|uniref:Large polyvalent protein-associated domain-containing protein n=1 Tax=Maribrevibacterium harenarium TaxID=2589817 RepID=A0A501W7B5_9GAMM|nr:CLCA_X family protein [Maribrevibacterium harenarium]TPE44592.1 hypothetical protein FJM67_16820 [Maribrevibacterium harenarium]